MQTTEHSAFERVVAGRLYSVQEKETMENKTAVNELFHHFCETTCLCKA